MHILSNFFRNRSKKQLLPWLLIGVPMVLSICYYVLIAAPRYQTESEAIVKLSMDQDAGSTLSDSALGALFGAKSTSGEDGAYLKDYILSLDMLKRLDQRLNLKKVFSETGADIFFHLPSKASQEWFLDYYRSRVSVSIDDKNSVLTIKTEGFTPEFAQRLNLAILDESEKFINNISNAMAREQMEFINTEVERNRKRLDMARDDMLAYQNHHGGMDPTAEVEAESSLIAGMEARQSQLEADLRNMQTYLNEDTPQIVSAKNAIEALKSQISQEKTKLIAPKGSKLNQAAADFIELKASVDFNTDLYKAALTAYEKSRVDASRKIKKLVVIVAPQRPERSNWPQNLMNLVTLLVVTVFLYLFARLVWTIIEDHRD